MWFGRWLSPGIPDRGHTVMCPRGYHQLTLADSALPDQQDWVGVRGQVGDRSPDSDDRWVVSGEGVVRVEWIGLSRCLVRNVTDVPDRPRGDVIQPADLRGGHFDASPHLLSQSIFGGAAQKVDRAASGPRG